MKLKQILILLLTLSTVQNLGCSYISGAMNYDDPLTAQEHNNLGVAYESEKKYKLAIREYKKASEMDESLVTPLVNLGNVYYKQGKFKKAKKYYLKALSKDSKNIEAANNLGNVYLRIGKEYEKGIDYLIAALPPPEIAPGYALDTLAMLYAANGSREKAAELLYLACKRIKNDEDLRSQIDTHLRELGQKSCALN